MLLLERPNGERVRISHEIVANCAPVAEAGRAGWFRKLLGRIAAFIGNDPPEQSDSDPYDISHTREDSRP